MDYLKSMEYFDMGQYTAGAATSSPLADVSNSSEDMQSYTATGNGSGQFLDTSTQNQIFGGLSKVLDYALQRDAYKMQMNAQLQQGPATQQQVVVQGKQTNFMFLALCGLGIYLVASQGAAK